MAINIYTNIEHMQQIYIYTNLLVHPMYDTDDNIKKC